MDVKKWFRDLHPTQIYFMLVLTSLYFALQLFMSHTTHALTLLVDAYHTLCNLIALAGCIISMRYGSANMKSEEDILGERLMCDMKTPSTCPSVMAEGLCESRYVSEHRLKNTFGWARIDVLVMLIGCVFLASLCFSLIIEALLTLIHIGHQDEMHHPILVFVVGIIGLLLNGLCLLLIGGYTAQKGKFLHTASNGEVVLDKVVTQTSGKKYQNEAQTITDQGEKLKPRDLARDIVGSILVIICSLVVYFTDEEVAKYVDPIFSIFSVVLLMVLSYPYLKKSGYILLQTIPDSININVLRSELVKAFPDIVNVHDLHIWQLTTSKVYSTAHIIFLSTKDYTQTTKEIIKFFQSQGISQVTIQPEFLKTDNMNGITVLPNVQDDHCLVQCQDPVCQQRHCCVTGKHELNSITTQSHNNGDTIISNLKSSCEEVQVVPTTKELIISTCTNSNDEADKATDESEELKKLNCINNCHNESCEEKTDINDENSGIKELETQVENCDDNEVQESDNNTAEDKAMDIHL